MRKMLLLLAVVALVVNWWVVDHATHAAEPYAGGSVLDVAGPDLNVRAYGNGSPDGAIVLLHGFTGSIRWWDKVAQPLADKTGRTVFAIDLVGHGGSESPRAAGAFGAEGQSIAVERALKALDVKDAVLVGHSMGGHIAVKVAESEPDLVDRVAVIDTYGAPGLVNLGVLHDAACWPVVGPAFDRLRQVDVMTKGTLQKAFAPTYPIPDLAYQGLKRLTQHALCDSTAGDEMNAQRAVSTRAADLGKPVLVIWGAQDGLTPTDANVASYRKAGVQPVVVKGAGHSPQVERPRKVVRLLSDFVASP